MILHLGTDMIRQVSKRIRGAPATRRRTTTSFCRGCLTNHWQFHDVSSSKMFLEAYLQAACQPLKTN
jgi:hypothetical protein